MKNKKSDKIKPVKADINSLNPVEILGSIDNKEQELTLKKVDTKNIPVKPKGKKTTKAKVIPKKKLIDKTVEQKQAPDPNIETKEKGSKSPEKNLDKQEETIISIETDINVPKKIIKEIIIEAKSGMEIMNNEPNTIITVTTGNTNAFETKNLIINPDPDPQSNLSPSPDNIKTDVMIEPEITQQPFVPEPKETHVEETKIESTVNPLTEGENIKRIESIKKILTAFEINSISVIEKCKTWKEITESETIFLKWKPKENVFQEFMPEAEKKRLEIIDRFNERKREIVDFENRKYDFDYKLESINIVPKQFLMLDDNKVRQAIEANRHLLEINVDSYIIEGIKIIKKTKK